MSYPVGTICIGQKFVTHPEYNGAEGEIIAPLQFRETTNYKTGVARDNDLVYRVRFHDGAEGWVNPQNLRLKRHDDEDKEAGLRAKDRSKVSTPISTCKAAAEKALAKREKV